jgi:TolA-binding protein
MAEPAEGAQGAGVEKELEGLRREVVEARNLVIKTDNLLKNIHAEIKLVARKQEQFERRHLLTSVTAMIIYALLAGAGAFLWARSEIVRSRARAEEASRRAQDSAADAEGARKMLADARAESERAARVFDRLNSGDVKVVTEALRDHDKLDRKLLSPMEAKALQARVDHMRNQAATEALERGKAAFRRDDWKAAADELGRYLALSPEGEEAPYAAYLLGNALYQARDHAGAVQALDKFLASGKEQRYHDYAFLILGQSLERGGDSARALEVYKRALELFPQSQFAANYRFQLRRLTTAAEPGPAPSPGAAPQAPAQPPGNAGTQPQ